MGGTIGIITDSRDDCQDLNLIFKIANLWNELLFQNFKVIWRESCAGHIYRPFTNTLAIFEFHSFKWLLWDVQEASTC